MCLGTVYVQAHIQVFFISKYIIQILVQILKTNNEPQVYVKTLSPNPDHATYAHPINLLLHHGEYLVHCEYLDYCKYLLHCEYLVLRVLSTL